MRNFISVILMMFLISGCSKTYKARFVDESGFLDDYSILQDGESDDAVLSFWKKDVDWHLYNKIIFEPIKVVKSSNAQINQLPHAERYRLAEKLEHRMREALKQDFRLVVRPASDTMRVQIAITEAETSWPLFDTFTALYPSARVLSELKMLVFGKESFVGSAGIEGKITDSETGELLMASVDRRAGSKTLSGITDDWDDVEEAYKYWAQQLRFQLCKKQAVHPCVEPD
ncbi:MAG: DUF3313 domain-containing protein [Gammaproteobacteria bacterium]